MRCTLLSIAVMLIVSSRASAHQMLLDARLKDDRIHVEVFYSTNEPARHAKVVIEKVSGEVVASGETDDEGIWESERPHPGSYVIRAESTGHAAKATLTVPAEPSALVESKPTREEMTQTPWKKIFLGLGAIAILTIGGRYILRSSR